jgi:hypothetical protein
MRWPTATERTILGGVDRARKALPFSSLDIGYDHNTMYESHVQAFPAHSQVAKPEAERFRFVRTGIDADGRSRSGDVMAGTGGVRKVRFAPPSRHTGKSGASSTPTSAAAVYLLTIFGKNEQEKPHGKNEKEIPSGPFDRRG